MKKFTPQNFESIFDHFSSIYIKGLKFERRDHEIMDDFLRSNSNLKSWSVLNFHTFLITILSVIRHISKWLLQQKKHIFPHTNISYPLIRAPTSAYKEVKNLDFRKIWCALFCCNTRFEIHLFALLMNTYPFIADFKQVFGC